MKKVFDRKCKNKGWLRASYTIEASILVPFILFSITGGIQLSYDLFQEAKESANVPEELQEFNPVEIVRRNMLLQEYIWKKE